MQPLTTIKSPVSLEAIDKDALSARIISQAYSTPNGELTSILQYTYQYVLLENEGYKEIAKTLEGISVAEMMHFKLIGKMLTRLGSNPVFTSCPPNLFSFYSSRSVHYNQNAKIMIEDDILAEKSAIQIYQRMTKYLKNQEVKKVIEYLLEDEKMHLERLKEIYSSL